MHAGILVLAASSLSTCCERITLHGAGGVPRQAVDQTRYDAEDESIDAEIWQLSRLLTLNSET